MAACRENKACAGEALQGRQSSTLKLVLGIDAVMFVAALAPGLLAASTALLSDSPDKLAEPRLDLIEKRIAELTRMRRSLRGPSAQCNEGMCPRCGPIIAALSPSA